MRLLVADRTAYYRNYHLRNAERRRKAMRARYHAKKEEYNAARRAAYMRRRSATRAEDDSSVNTPTLPGQSD